MRLSLIQAVELIVLIAVAVALCVGGVAFMAHRQLTAPAPPGHIESATGIALNPNYSNSRHGVQGSTGGEAATHATNAVKLSPNPMYETSGQIQRHAGAGGAGGIGNGGASAARASLIGVSSGYEYSETSVLSTATTTTTSDADEMSLKPNAAYDASQDTLAGSDTGAGAPGHELYYEAGSVTPLLDPPPAAEG